MLIHRRKQGQWVQITHKSGDVVRVLVQDLSPFSALLGFDDDARNFTITRPERAQQDPVPPPPRAA